MPSTATQISLHDLTEDQPAPIPAAEAPLETKVRQAIDTLKARMAEGYHFLVAVSFGKDSSVLANIALQALREQVEDTGSAPTMVFCLGDTLVENPVVGAFARAEADKLRAYLEGHQLPGRMDIVTPNLSDHYWVQLIAGRTVATLPDNGAKCSQMMKVNPITSHKRAVMRELGAERVITLVGKRRDESAARARNMAERGENAMDAIADNRGELVLSPLADFTLNDVFSYIGQVRGGRTPAYSDFEDLVEVYRGANGGECMVTVHLTGRAASTGCGARHGCWCCLRVQRDASMENMLAEHQYAWMRPLNQLRNYIAAEHYNPSKRAWLSRTVQDDGSITIAPNAYSPAHCEDLLRFALTIQVEEAEAAAEAGLDEPRFTLLTPADVIAIELSWLRYGYHNTLAATAIVQEIANGARYHLPEVDYHWPASALPASRTTARFADADYHHVGNGLRDVDAWAAGAVNESPARSDGTLYTNVPEGEVTAVDPEAAELYFAFEAEHALATYRNQYPAAAYHYFLRLGVFTTAKGGRAEIDRMLRYGNQVQRLGLAPILHDPVAIVDTLKARFGNDTAAGGGFQDALF